MQVNFLTTVKIKLFITSNPTRSKTLNRSLNNCENLMFHHRKKTMKTYEIDVIEQNYKHVLVLILYTLHNEHAFEWKILEAIMFVRLETIDQIKDSLIVKNSSAELEEKEEPIKLDQTNYVECIKIAVQKVVNKLSKSMKPQTSKALLKDIENQINNI